MMYFQTNEPPKLIALTPQGVAGISLDEIQPHEFTLTADVVSPAGMREVHRIAGMEDLKLTDPRTMAVR